MYLDAKVLSGFFKFWEFVKIEFYQSQKIKSIFKLQENFEFHKAFFSGLFLTFTTLGRHDYF